MSEETQDGKKVAAQEGQPPNKPRRRRVRITESDVEKVAPKTPKNTAEVAPKTNADPAEQTNGTAQNKPSRRRRRSRKRNSAGSPGEGDKRKKRTTQSGDGRRRTQNKRRSRGSKRNGKSRSHDSSRRSKNSQRQRGQRHKSTTPESKFGGREPRVQGDYNSRSGPLELTPFELFCAYHLGVTDDNRYRQPNMREVAKRFNCSINEIEDALKRFGFDRDSMRQTSYDLSLAQLDIQVAPEGIDKKELAKGLFEEFLEISPKAREAQAQVDNAPAAEISTQ